MTSWMKNLLINICNAVSAFVAETRDALVERLQSMRETASLLYNRMVKNMGYEQERLKHIVEKEAEEDQQQEEGEEEDVDLTPQVHERALKGACRSFVISGLPKADIDSCFYQTKPHIKTLIENQLKEIGSAKVMMTLWVRWKKRIMPLIKLDPEDAKNAQDLDDGTTGDNYIRVEMPFNSFMTEFFEANDINDLIQHVLGYFRAQTENPKFS